MTPLELCEPLFTKVCLLNRLGRKGGDVAGYDQLRLQIEGASGDVRERSARGDDRRTAGGELSVRAEDVRLSRDRPSARRPTRVEIADRETSGGPVAWGVDQIDPIQASLGAAGSRGAEGVGLAR